MQSILTDAQRHLLRIIFDRGAEGASQALSKWLAEEVHLAVSEVELVELEQAAELLGPADSVVAACIMGLTGRLTGLILLVFEDRSGFALLDLLLHQPIGTTTAWGELEQSGAKERDGNNFPIFLKYAINSQDRSPTPRRMAWTPMHRESNG
jgi:chemotaxis protein CheC